MQTESCSPQRLGSVHAPTLSHDDIFSALLNAEGDDALRDFMERHVHLFAQDDLLVALKAESERYQKVDPYASLRLAQALKLAGTLAARPEHHAFGLLAIGDALWCLGRYEESLATLEEAGREFQAQNNQVGWARTRLGWLIVSHRLGHGAEALAAVDHARDILTRHAEWLRAAGLDLNTAYVCCELGQYERALALYDRAHEIYASLGESAESRAAWTKTNKAILLTTLGDFETALQLLGETRDVYLRRGDAVSVLRQDQNIAWIYAAQGRYTQALQRYTAVLASMEDAGLEVDAAWVVLNMVECYLSLNRNPEALEMAEDMIARFERYGTPIEAAKARFYSALAHQRSGNREGALDLFDRSAQTFEDAGLAVQSHLVTLQLAVLYLAAERWEEAMDGTERVREFFAERGLVIRQAQAELIQARAALGLGEHERAGELARSALEISRVRDVPWLAHEAHHILGRIATMRGDPHGALEEYERAMADIERVQSSLAIELRTGFLEDKLQIYGDAIDTGLGLSRPELAFGYLERAKSRTLVDYLASNLGVQVHARAGANEEMLATLARLREEHAWLYSRRYGYGLGRRQGEAQWVGDETMQEAIRDRERRIARIVERLALELADGLAPVSMGSSSELPECDAETILLEYYLRDRTGVVFVASGEGMSAVPLTEGADEVSRLVTAWHRNLASAAQFMAVGRPLNGLGQNAIRILARLYDVLIRPVAPHVAGCKRLIIVPYGPTHTIPFHALHDGTGYLVERFDVSICPSSSLLRLCTNRPHRPHHSALVMAHSNDGRLPAVLQEAQAVSTLLPGESYCEEAATRETLVQRAPHHSVLHLAAHAEARLDNPVFAHVKLADGLLSTVDVFNLQLNGALVTLSACETGRSVVVGGDELIGLSRGFLYAGASTLVQSLWRVEDSSSARLMEYFYRALCEGRRKSSALRQAQLNLLAAHSIHPYMWAPFELVGDSGPL